MGLFEGDAVRVLHCAADDRLRNGIAFVGNAKVRLQNARHRRQRMMMNFLSFYSKVFKTKIEQTEKKNCF